MKPETIPKVNNQEVPTKRGEQDVESLLTPEILGQKMDDEIARVLIHNGSEQLGQTEASLGIDQAQATEYRAESGVDEKLAENTDEIGVLRKNTEGKMKYGAQNEGYEFSKKYSPLQRKIMAEKILGEREVLMDGGTRRRPRYYNDEKSQQRGREKRLLFQKGKLIEVEQKIQEQGTSYDKEIEDLQKELLKTQDLRRSHLGEIHGEIVGTEQALGKYKSSILGRIGLVRGYKWTIASLEVQLQIKRDSFGSLKDQYLSREKDLQEQIGRLENIKKIWNEEKQSILQDVDRLSTEMIAQKQRWKEQVADFYDVQKDVAMDFEQSGDDRQLGKYMEQEGAWFLHGIPLGEQQMGNTAGNNTSLDTRDMKGADKMRLLVAIEPAISVSVVKRSDQTTMYNTGAVLVGGQILSAYDEDAATINQGLDVRTAKYDGQRGDSSVQQEIGTKLKKVIDNAARPGSGGTHWNEVVVKRPNVGAIFLRINSEYGQWIDKKSLIDAMDLATEFGVPVLNIDKTGKARDLITGEEVSQSDLLKGGVVKMTAEERRNTVERILSEQPVKEAEEKAMLERAHSLHTGERQSLPRSTLRILLDLPRRLVEIMLARSRNKDGRHNVVKAGENILDENDLPVVAMKQEWADVLALVADRPDFISALNRVNRLNKATDRYRRDNTTDVFAESEA